MFSLELNLRRSVAEILIIVLGILIALGVDSWNSNRIDRNVEAEYLSRLAEDAARNAQLAADIIEALKRKRALLDQLAETVMETQKLDRSDATGTILAIGAGTDLGWTFPSFPAYTFDEMRSTGRIGLIQDVALRAALTQYHTELRSEVARINARRTGFPAHAYALLPPEQMVELMELNSPLPTIEVNAALRDRIMAALDDAEFASLLNAERNFAEFAIQSMDVLKQHSEQIVSGLNRALEN